jgi:hypothetical protein
MKTSVWLPDDVAAEWKRREIPLAELVKRGLAADEPEPLDEKIRRIVREELAAVPDDERIQRIIRDELERVSRR